MRQRILQHRPTRYGAPMMQIAWIALGGALGTAVRVLLSTAMLATLGPAIPYGTLTVNLVGSFLIGLLFPLGTASGWLSPTGALALTTGFLGGMTTFSTFSLDAYKMVQAGSWAGAATYVAMTVGGCLASTGFGVALGEWLVGNPAVT